MPLATILGVCALLVSPSPGTRPANSFVSSSFLSLQDSPATKPDQQPAAPEPENKPVSSPAAPAENSEPAQENPPPSGTQGAPPSTPQPESPASPSPAQNSEPPSAPPATETGPTQAAKPTTTRKPASTHRRRAKTTHATSRNKNAKVVRKPVAKTGMQPAGQPTVTKKVVRNGGTADPTIQISPSLTQQQSATQRKNVSQILSATDANLKKLSGRQISSTQKDTVTQIQQLMQQAKTASDAGDMERARNLAVKARVLSEELIKH